MAGGITPESADGGVEKIAGFVGNVWGDEDPSDLAGNG
jgi:hypothetical protein